MVFLICTFVILVGIPASLLIGKARIIKKDDNDSDKLEIEESVA
jgi:hypothetical protein